LRGAGWVDGRRLPSSPSARPSCPTFAAPALTANFGADGSLYRHVARGPEEYRRRATTDDARGWGCVPSPAHDALRFGRSHGADVVRDASCSVELAREGPVFVASRIPSKHVRYAALSTAIEGGRAMRKALELVLCFLHPIAVILIWVSLFVRTELGLLAKLTWAVAVIIPLVPFLFVLTGNEMFPRGD